jgi:hypothetical protein
VEGEKLCIKLKSSFGKWQLRSIRNTAWKATLCRKLLHQRLRSLTSRIFS